MRVATAALAIACALCHFSSCKREERTPAQSARRICNAERRTSKRPESPSQFSSHSGASEHLSGKRLHRRRRPETLRAIQLRRLSRARWWRHGPARLWTIGGFTAASPETFSPPSCRAVPTACLLFAIAFLNIRRGKSPLTYVRSAASCPKTLLPIAPMRWT